MVTKLETMTFPVCKEDLKKKGWTQVTYEAIGYQTWLNPMAIPINIHFDGDNVEDMFIPIRGEH
jgi:hypothetical protein